VIMKRLQIEIAQVLPVNQHPTSAEAVPRRAPPHRVWRRTSALVNRRIVESHEKVNDGGFATPRAPNQRTDLTLAEVERHALKNLVVVSEGSVMSVRW
jgi:hypothetical protein